jgi:hypothetical protein
MRKYSYMRGHRHTMVLNPQQSPSSSCPYFYGRRWHWDENQFKAGFPLNGNTIDF